MQLPNLTSANDYGTASTRSTADLHTAYVSTFATPTNIAGMTDDEIAANIANGPVGVAFDVTTGKSAGIDMPLYSPGNGNWEAYGHWHLRYLGDTGMWPPTWTGPRN